MGPAKKLFSDDLSFGSLAGHAWRSLSGNWGISIGANLLVGLIYALASSALGYGGGFARVLLFPLEVGSMLFFLSVVRGEKPTIEMLFKPFTDYGRCLWGCLRIFFFVFLWSLLFIVPGIIASLRYSMTFFIMLDHPEYSVKQAMEESSEITRGYKWRIFGYELLWGLIALAVVIPTIGIGALWLVQWIDAFYASLYESLRREPETVTPLRVVPQLLPGPAAADTGKPAEPTPQTEPTRPADPEEKTE